MDKPQEQAENNFGLDRTQKANIRPNGQKAPKGIDYDMLINKALKGKSGANKTSLGFVNDQEQFRPKK